jgi:hypothetical protein
MVLRIEDSFLYLRWDCDCTCYLQIPIYFRTCSGDDDKILPNWDDHCSLVSYRDNCIEDLSYLIR